MESDDEKKSYTAPIVFQTADPIQIPSEDEEDDSDVRSDIGHSNDALVHALKLLAQSTDTRLSCVCPKNCSINDWAEFISRFEDELMEKDITRSSQKLKFLKKCLKSGSQEYQLYVHVVLSYEEDKHRRPKYTEVIEAITDFKTGGHMKDWWFEYSLSIEQGFESVLEYTAKFTSARFLCKK